MIGVASLGSLLALLFHTVEGAHAAVAFVSSKSRTFSVVIDVTDAGSVTRADLVAKHWELLLVTRVVCLQVFVTALALC